MESGNGTRVQRALGTATAVSEGYTAPAVWEGRIATAVVEEEDTTATVVEEMSDARSRLSLLVFLLYFLHLNLAMEEIEE